MAENYKHLYEQMKIMVEKYQDEIVPGLREQLEKRVEVVRCRECIHQMGDGACCVMDQGGANDDFCSYGERRKDER